MFLFIGEAAARRQEQGVPGTGRPRPDDCTSHKQKGEFTMFSLFGKKSKEGENDIVSIAKGRMFPLEEVKDEVFSKKMMGEGAAFELGEDQVCAPASGELTALFPTGHAFGIRRKDGVELLVHIGIDTVELSGEGFTIQAKQGDKVKAGDPIVKVDRALVSGKGYDLSTMLLVTDPKDKDIQFTGYGEIEKGVKIG